MTGKTSKKVKTKFVCSACGYESVRWLGRCPECEGWNTFNEEVFSPEQVKRVNARGASITSAMLLKDIQTTKADRIQTHIEEFDRVLGGGFIPGSIILLAGDPGIGKSTLVLQAAASLQETVLYVSGEESAEQIKLRADRLHTESDTLHFLPETELSVIRDSIDKIRPSLVIIDSIQTIYSEELQNTPGSVTQLRECTTALMEIAKKQRVTVIIIGHITKEGAIAGPKILEHIVDTVIMFEGESSHNYRILRAQKNRFGSVNEIGVFEMHDSGLRQVLNPSELFLRERKLNIPGSVITCSIEGARPLLIEVQGLVTPSHFGNPQRLANGIDYRRLSILLAVIEKRCGHRLSAANVFLNITGGLRIDEPAIDLPTCCAVVSSFLDKQIDPTLVIAGEVGLGGEIRSISNIEKRVQESAKLGFEKIMLPASNLKLLTQENGIRVIGINHLSEALEWAIH
jgi:DNA repair protein RadA/Sms